MTHRHAKLTVAGVCLVGSALTATAACTGTYHYTCGETRVLVRVNSDFASSNLVVGGGCSSALCINSTDSGGCSEWSATWPAPKTNPALPCSLTLKLADGGSVNSVVPAPDSFCEVSDTYIEAGFDTSR